RRDLLTWAAAAIVIVSLGGGLSLVRWRATRGDALVEAAVDGHVRSLMADHLFDVQSTDQHAVKPWFLGRLDFSPPVVGLPASPSRRPGFRWSAGASITSAAGLLPPSSISGGNTSSTCSCVRTAAASTARRRRAVRIRAADFTSATGRATACRSGRYRT